MRVLLVDDSSAVRERLKALFIEIAAVEIVSEAKDEAEALELVRRLNPEVIVLDIQMSGGSGIHLTQKLKKGKRPPLVIVLTNLSDRQYRRKCMDAGADFFFDKSSEFKKVTQVLNRYDPKVTRTRQRSRGGTSVPGLSS